jgi:hypothetical protein
MKRFWITLLAVAMAIVIALPAAALKPDKPEKPGKPGSGPTSPPACAVTESFVGVDGVVPLAFDGAGEYTTHWIYLPAEKLLDHGDLNLCVEVTVASGTLGDMNVALVDYDDQAARRCGFYWPGGKITEGDVFNVGFSLYGYDSQPGFCGSDSHSDDDGGLVVLVRPKLHAKSGAGALDVKVGFADVAS